MSNPVNFSYQEPKGNGCAVAAAWGCGSIAFLVILALAGFASNGGAVFPILLVAALIIFVVVRNRRASGSGTSEPGPLANSGTAPQSQPASSASSASYRSLPTPTYNGAPPATSNFSAPNPDSPYSNPLCRHTFTEAQIEENEALACACGNYFETADIKKYTKLVNDSIALNKKLNEIQDKIRIKSNESHAQQVAKASAGTVTASAPATAANEWKPRTTLAAQNASPVTSAAPTPVIPPKPTFKKPTATFSLQQWLIIGAAIMVMVAGSAFVVQGIQAGWSPLAFTAVTVSIGLATGFGAFFMRRTSIVVATFLAAFSSAMQLTTMWTIGDLISTGKSWHFAYNSQPLWWWAIELFVVAVAALFLARASRLNGWKAIALLSMASSAVTLELGPIRDLIGAHPDWALLNLSIVTITSVATLFGSKVLRAIPAAEIKDDKYREYFEDLAERQNKAFFSAARVATALQLVAGVGATVGGSYFLGIFAQAPNIFAILALIAVAIGVSRTSKHWAGQLSETGEPSARINAVANGTIFIAISAAIISMSVMIPVGSVWASELVALASILAVAWFTPRAKSLQPSAAVSTATMWVSAVLWSAWTASRNGEWFAQGQQQTFGWFLVGLAVVVTLADFRLKSNHNTWPSIVANGLGLFLLASPLILSEAPNAGFTVTALGIAVAANAPLALRSLIQRREKDDVALSVGAWVSFAVSAALVVSLSTFRHLTSATLTDTLLFATAFVIYAVVAQLLALRGPLKGKAAGVLAANHYLGQAVVAIVGLELYFSPTVEVSAGTLTMLLAALVAINYGFGVATRQAVKLHIGYLLSLAAFFLNLWQSKTGSLTSVTAVELAVVSAFTAAHIWALSSRTDASAPHKNVTAVLGVSGSLGVGLSMTSSRWMNATNQESFWVLAIVALLAIGSLGLSRVKRASKSDEQSTKPMLASMSLVFAAFGILTIAEYAQQARTVDIRWYSIAAIALLSVVLRLAAGKDAKRELGALFLVTNLVLAAFAASLTADQLNTGTSPEPYTLWFSAALIASVLLSRNLFGDRVRSLLVDAPVLGTSIVSFAFGLIATDAASSSIADVRRIAASAVVSGFALLRVRRGAASGWLTAGYVSAVALGASIAYTVSQRSLPNFNGPEIYSLLIAASLVATTLVAGEAASKLRKWMLFEVPAIGVAASSLLFGLVAPGGIDTDLRRILGAGLIAVIAILRLRTSDSRPWMALAYLSSVATALSVAGTIQNNLTPDFKGVEIYSLLAAASVVGVHRVALKHLELKSTLFSWGLPIGIALLPSTFYTYTSWGQKFSELGGDQIAREVLVLVISTALLTLGLRKGNLANASMGIAGLSLLIVPAVASQSSGNWQVQNTALAAGLMLAGILGIAKLAGKAKGTSMLFFGIPITIALAPALFFSLAALGHQQLEPIDWWRFGILISASMAMLVLGTMREVAGLFYPGLVGVILTVLPYGFKQAAQGTWYMVALLLLLAGVMVWLAMRLEKMRKEGRTSSQWLRELK